MRVLIVTSGIAPESGGPTRSVKGLCRALSERGVDVTLLVLRGEHVFEDQRGVRITRGWGVGLRESDLPQFDLAHIQGLWDLGLHRVVAACRRQNVRYVISPRGMLDPWALSVKKWKKKLALLCYQRGDLRRAAAFHVTATLERRNVRALGIEQPIIIAPNGVDTPAVMPPRTNGGEEKTAIFLSRLHPGKGLLTLAEAWAQVRPQGWVMKVVGPDSYGHKAEVVSRLDALGIRDQWRFVDMLDDDNKWVAYRGADLLVHPSVSENFGITIAEGLSAELPIICTDGTPWAEVSNRKCGWYIKAGSVSALADALREATTSRTLAEMGRNGRMFIEERYTWAAVCDEMLRGYTEVLNGRA